MSRLDQTRPFDLDVTRRLGAKPRVHLGVLAGLLVAAGVLSLSVAAQTSTVASTQLPTGGQVNAGQASISQSGNTLNVNQTSQRAVVDWNTFNVGKDATVNFQQPNAQSATLNRVADTQPSQILGRITAPGQVVLVNPQGVYFGKSSSVDVGGLVATTHNASNQEFMDGQIKLTRNGATGKVENEGELRAALGGYIALLAPEVRNNGVIVANLGTVAMAAGESFELKFDGAGVLSSVRVSAATINTLVENKNAVRAPGGLIILSAQAASRLQSGVVNNSGIIEAAGMVRRAGRILLEATSSILNSGALKADATGGLQAGPAGSVTLTAPDVQNTGTLSATNLTANSFLQSGSLAADIGRITIQADTFTQTDSGLLDVSAVAQQAGIIDIAAAQAMGLSGRVFANGVVNNPSQIVANALGGIIQLQASRRVDLTTAVLDASGEGGAGRIHIQADGVPVPVDNPTQAPVKGVVLLSNNTVLRANSNRAQAGRVEIEGDDITLDTGTLIEARGSTKGGTVLVGGDWQGSGTMRQATTVTMSADSTIDASATDNGDGGKVVMWTDVMRIDSTTTVQGRISAQAGAWGGNGGWVETSGHSLSISGARINAHSSSGKSGLWLIDPTDVTIDTNTAATIVSGLATTDVRISADRDIVISAYIATNTNNKLLFTAGGSINMTGGYNIWLNTSNSSTYSASTGTGSLYMGGADVTTITSSNWNSSCVTTCYAQASTTLPYAGVRLGVSSAVDIRAGGDVVVAGRNTQTTGGYAGNVLFSGSVVWGNNVSFYGISSAGVGQQLSWGSTAQIDLKATNTLFIAGESSYYTTNAPMGYGTFLNGTKLTGATVELWGRNTNASCTAANWCAGVSLGWIDQASQQTNIYADVLKLKSNTVALGASPVNVSKLNSTFGIDVSSYDSSSSLGFKNNVDAVSSVLPVAGNNYGGSLVLPSGVGTNADPWSVYRYSGNSSVSVNTAIYSTGPIGITATDIALNSNLYTTNTSTGDITLTGNVSGSGNISLASGRGLTVTQLGTSIYKGVISGTNATLSKLGAGRLNLTNLNTYTGGTTL
ncbi:MAG: filamentous hemagglutinin N-terminal domain-containing protein, partial [Limnohabitans sp.]